MMMKRNVLSMVLVMLFALSQTVFAAAPKAPSAKEKCAVCGMFVAKYPKWVASITTDTGKVLYFDGAKDMFAYYFQPQRFVKKTAGTAAEIHVIDYYSVQPIDGKAAFYVMGSDVYGPMGKEFIPFAGKKAAENFMADHKGKKILTFDQVTTAMVEKMRSGMKMKMKMDH